MSSVPAGTLPVRLRPRQWASITRVVTKKICFEEDSPYQSSTSGAVWWISNWEQGVTEPGSSGSPLFDQNQRIIGQLFGGAAACSGSVNNGSFDYYGRMDESWTLGVAAYLDPLGTGQLTLDGYPTNSSANLGCTLPSACNYDPNATKTMAPVKSMTPAAFVEDSTSCVGCADASACNYDMDATIEDDGCVTLRLDKLATARQKELSTPPWPQTRLRHRSHSTPPVLRKRCPSH